MSNFHYGASYGGPFPHGYNPSLPTHNFATQQTRSPHPLPTVTAFYQSHVVPSAAPPGLATSPAQYSGFYSPFAPNNPSSTNSYLQQPVNIQGNEHAANLLGKASITVPQSNYSAERLHHAHVSPVPTRSFQKARNKKMSDQRHLGQQEQESWQKTSAVQIIAQHDGVSRDASAEGDSSSHGSGSLDLDTPSVESPDSASKSAFLSKIYGESTSNEQPHERHLGIDDTYGTIREDASNSQSLRYLLSDNSERSSNERGSPDEKNAIEGPPTATCVVPLSRHSELTTQKEVAGAFVALLCRNKITYPDLVQEGLPSDLLRDLFQELGLSVAVDPSTSLETTGHLDINSLMQRFSPSQLHPPTVKDGYLNTSQNQDYSSTLGLAAKVQTPQHSASLADASPIPPDMQESHSPKDAGANSQSAQPDARAQYLQRLAKAKAKKKVPAMSASQQSSHSDSRRLEERPDPSDEGPAESSILSRSFATESKTVHERSPTGLDSNHSARPSPEDRKKAQTELVRKKLQALSKQKLLELSNDVEKQLESNDVTMDSFSALQGAPLEPPRLSIWQSTPFTTTPTSGIPGLFMAPKPTADFPNSSTAPNAVSVAQQPIAATLNRKHPLSDDSSDYYDQDQPATKRSFGQSRQNSDEDLLIIEVSDDDSDNGSERATKISKRLKTHHSPSMVYSPDHPRRPYGYPLTPSQNNLVGGTVAGHYLATNRTDPLEQKTREIEAIKKRIELMERKRNSRSQILGLAQLDESAGASSTEATPSSTYFPIRVTETHAASGVTVTGPSPASYEQEKPDASVQRPSLQESSQLALERSQASLKSTASDLTELDQKIKAMREQQRHLKAQREARRALVAELERRGVQASSLTDLELLARTQALSETKAQTTESTSVANPERGPNTSNIALGETEAVADVDNAVPSTLRQQQDIWSEGISADDSADAEGRDGSLADTSGDAMETSSCDTGEGNDQDQNEDEDESEEEYGRLAGSMDIANSDSTENQAEHNGSLNIFSAEEGELSEDARHPYDNENLPQSPTRSSTSPVPAANLDREGRSAMTWLSDSAELSEPIPNQRLPSRAENIHLESQQSQQQDFPGEAFVVTAPFQESTWDALRPKIAPEESDADEGIESTDFWRKRSTAVDASTDKGVAIPPSASISSMNTSEPELLTDSKPVPMFDSIQVKAQDQYSSVPLSSSTLQPRPLEMSQQAVSAQSADTETDPYASNSTSHSFKPYQSPLKFFKAYRYHPSYTDETSLGFKSLTYSNRVDVNIEWCPTEANGENCTDDACPHQHIRQMTMEDNDILLDIATNPGLTSKAQDEFRAGLRGLLGQLKQEGVEDTNEVAKALADYRRAFMNDESRILKLD